GREMTDWKSSLRADPTEFLLENGSPPIVFRMLSEVLVQPETDIRREKARREIAEYPPAVGIVRKQRNDGSWGGTITMAGSPNPFLSTEFSLDMLFEYGWDKNAAPIKKAAKLLKTFLSERKDIGLCESQSQVKADDMRQRYY